MSTFVLSLGFPSCVYVNKQANKMVKMLNEKIKKNSCILMYLCIFGQKNNNPKTERKQGTDDLTK